MELEDVLEAKRHLAAKESADGLIQHLGIRGIRFSAKVKEELKAEVVWQAESESFADLMQQLETEVAQRWRQIKTAVVKRLKQDPAVDWEAGYLYPDDSELHKHQIEITVERRSRTYLKQLSKIEFVVMHTVKLTD